MQIRFGPLINKLTGPFNKKHVIRTRKDGSIVIARRSVGMGHEADHPAIKYMQESWRLLDAYWGTLSHADKIEWAKCSPRVHGKRVTGFIHFKTVNLRRHHVNLPALQRPPDSFRNHRRQYKMEHSYLFPHGGRQQVKGFAVWVGLETKPGPPDPPPGVEPPPDNPCMPPIQVYTLCPWSCYGCEFTYASYGPWHPIPRPPDWPWLAVYRVPPELPPDPHFPCQWLGFDDVYWMSDEWEFKGICEHVECMDHPSPPFSPGHATWQMLFDIRVLHIPSMRYCNATVGYNAEVQAGFHKCPHDMPFWFEEEIVQAGDLHLEWAPQIPLYGPVPPP